MLLGLSVLIIQTDVDVHDDDDASAAAADTEDMMINERKTCFFNSKVCKKFLFGSSYILLGMNLREESEWVSGVEQSDDK